MKFACLLLILFVFDFCIGIHAQNVGFSDDFSDGNLNQNPTWHGDTSKFGISAGELWLNDSSETSLAILYLPSKAIENASWEFDLSMDFSPSGSNFCKIYLVADHPNPDSVQNGYFVQIGGQSGSVDDVSLYKLIDGTETELIDGSDGLVATDPTLSIKVTKSGKQLSLFTDTSISRNSYVQQGSVKDSSIGESSFFIIECIYTSTRSDKFFFDNFAVSGEKFRDTVPPKLLSAKAGSDSTILVIFSENLSPTSLNTLNFEVNASIGNPLEAQFDPLDSSKIKLVFQQKFQNAGNYLLQVKNVTDKDSNIAGNQSMPFVYFVPDTAIYREVVINEIYADESPSNGLPEAEYIEIFNASNKLFDLKNWSLVDGSGSTLLDDELIFAPGEYIILCSADDSADYSSFGTVLSCDFPTLTNAGEKLILKNAAGEAIDSLYYTAEWYENGDKDEGGYSLEQINPFALCSGKSNFKASEAVLGGTPGTENSVFDDFPDNTPPNLTEAIVLSDDSIALFFNEKLDTSSIHISDFELGNKRISSFDIVLPEMELVYLSLANPIDSGKFFELHVRKISDCPGNEMQEQTRKLILPYTAQPQDLVINEILFNPRSGGYDFVELYNRSQKIISLDKLKAANWENGEIANFKSVASEGKYIYPDGYYVFTENKENIAREYPKTDITNLYEIENLPAFNDDVGAVFLVDEKKQTIDSFFYNEEMHFELLQELDGVSLERVNPDIASDASGNFQSASESEGFATPGYLNSQYFVSIKNEGKISVDPELFSPDNDGYHDILNIHYQFDAPNFVANVSIFNKNGRMLRSLAKNELLGKEGNIVWDGLTDDKEKARIGIYIIYFEVFKLDGSKMAFKETCVLAGFLE